MAHSAAIMTTEPVTGWVASDRSELRIVVRQWPNGYWEPLFAVEPNTQGKRELPGCFSLNEEAVTALNAALQHSQR